MEMKWKGGELAMFFESVIEKAKKENPEIAEAMEIFELSMESYRTTLQAMEMLNPVVNEEKVVNNSRGEFDNVYISTDVGHGEGW